MTQQFDGETQAEVEVEGAIYRELADAFNAFDEIWAVGHKGDIGDNLRALGVLDPERPFDVSHVHSSLGINSLNNIPTPKGSAGSYASILTAASPLLEEEIKRLVAENRTAVVLMPFPNAEFSAMIARNGAEKHIVTTSPIDDVETFFTIENKLTYAELIEAALMEDMPENLIPTTRLNPNTTYRDILQVFDIEEGHPVYLQIALSAGGDGTVKISTQEEYSRLFEDEKWALAFAKESIKAGKGIIGKDGWDPYSANGTGCIVPMPDGTVSVYLDPLSHKPVGLESLRGKEGSGNGNDWGTPYPAEVTSQYERMGTLAGRELYRRFGVTGLFGPDCVVGFDKNGEMVFMNEINPRQQGTTPYQTLNAMMNGRLPLEVIHYASKLLPPKRLQELLPNPDSYNEASVNEAGGYYVKIGGPKKRIQVKSDLNGPWIYDLETQKMKQLTEINLTVADVYTRNFEDIEVLEAAGKKLVWVKGPNPGDTVGGELAPIGYILGSGLQVFDVDHPDATKHCVAMFENISKRLYD